MKLKRLIASFLTLGYGTNVFEAGSPKRLTASGQVLGAAGSLMGIFVASASATPTITVYDGLDNTGTVLVNTFTPVAGTFYPMPFVVMKGIFVVISGTVDCTVAYAGGQ